MVTLSDVLSSEEAAQLCVTLLDGEDQQSRDAAAKVKTAVLSHPLFLLIARPRKLSRPLFRRYDEGMGASTTIHDAIIGERNGIRADLVVVVLLSGLSDFDGGDLVIDTGYGEENIKAPAGHCVIYPASATHGIRKVTRGTQWMAEISVQSLVRDAMRREILYDIACSAHLIELFGQTPNPDLDRLQKCEQNLLRLWAER